jgi:transketolase
LNLKEISKNIRRTCISQVTRAKSYHVGSMLSSVDILTYIFYKELDMTKENHTKTRDRFILSKGHASLALYAILSEKGIINNINDYCTNGSYLIGHLNHKVPGVDVSTGSLGHGLSTAAGICLGLNMDKNDDIEKDKHQSKVYCVIGDGECDEGSVWEALIFIANNRLNNLIIIVDANKLQGYDFTEKILPEKRLISMLKSTGLSFYEADGHDFDEIAKAFDFAKKSKDATILFFHTIKGKGVSFMENKLEWHYKTPNAEELRLALEELK